MGLDSLLQNTDRIWEHSWKQYKHIVIYDKQMHQITLQTTLEYYYKVNHPHLCFTSVTESQFKSVLLQDWLFLC